LQCTPAGNGRFLRRRPTFVSALEQQKPRPTCGLAKPRRDRTTESFQRADIKTSAQLRWAKLRSRTLSSRTSTTSRAEKRRGAVISLPSLLIPSLPVRKNSEGDDEEDEEDAEDEEDEEDGEDKAGAIPFLGRSRPSFDDPCRVCPHETRRDGFLISPDSIQWWQNLKINKNLSRDQVTLGLVATGTKKYIKNRKQNNNENMRVGAITRGVHATARLNVLRKKGQH